MKLSIHLSLIIMNFLCFFSLSAMDHEKHDHGKDTKHSLSQSAGELAVGPISQSQGSALSHQISQSAGNALPAYQQGATKVPRQITVAAAVQAYKDNSLAAFAKQYQPVRTIRSGAYISLKVEGMPRFRGYSCAMHPKKNEALIASDNGIYIWQFGLDQGNVNRLPMNNEEFQTVLYSPGGKYCAALAWTGGAYIFDADSKVLKLVVPGSSPGVLGCEFTSDETHFMIGTSNKAPEEKWPAEYFQLNSGKKVDAKIPGCEVACKIVANSKDSASIAHAGADCNIYLAGLAEVANKTGFKKLQGHQQGIIDLCFNSKNTLIASASYDRTARVWDAKSGKCLQVLDHAAPISCVQFTQWKSSSVPSINITDFLVTGCHDGSINVWDAMNGSKLCTCVGHTDQITSMRIHPNGYLLLTTSMDRSARLWDIRRGKQLISLAGHTDWVMDAVFAADNKNVITVSLDGTARLWDTSFLFNPGDWTMIRNETLTNNQRGLLALLDKDSNQKLKNREPEVERLVIDRCALVAEQNQLPTADLIDVYYSFDAPVKQAICRRYKMRMSAKG